MYITQKRFLFAASAILLALSSTVSAAEPYVKARLAGGVFRHRAGLGHHAVGAESCDAGSDCYESAHGLRHGHHRIGNLGHGLIAAHYNGLPCIDPYMSADWIAQQQANTRSWHAGYYDTQYGAPLALVVPPTVRTQTRFGWGVNQTTMLPIYHQYDRPYPGAVGGGEGAYSATTALRPTPRWPSHTDQFGVYYIRGPW